jgi:hypothetical protein
VEEVMTEHQRDPLDEAIAGFLRMPVPDPPDSAELLAALAADAAARRGMPITRFTRIRRFLMRPFVPYLSAAALLLGTLAWLSSGFSNSIALAEVIQAASQHKLVRYQLHEIADYGKHGPAEATRTVYADLTAPRLRIETKGLTLNKVLEAHSVMVQDNQRDRFLKLISHTQVVDKNHADKLQAMVIKLVEEKGLAKKEAFLYRPSYEDGTPFYLDDLVLVNGRTLLESLHDLEGHKETVSSRATLDGRETLKYHLREKDRTTELWVDPRTKLPLRIENVLLRPYPEVAKSTSIYSGFEWDPAGADPAMLFSTEPPPGFAFEDHTRDDAARAVERQEKKPGGPAAEHGPDSPESAAVLKKLDGKVPMQFPNKLPLVEVLKYIRTATRGATSDGIPFAFDTEGLKRAGQTRASLVSIDIEDRPLKESLAELLQPLGLAYEVRDGVLTITSKPGQTKTQ